MGPNLLPCAQGLVLSVLPGLEEEQGESFAAALNLLDGVGGIVGPTRYFRMLLLLTLQSPTSRYAVLNVLLRRLPRLSTTDGMPHAALLAPPGTGAALKPPSPPPPPAPSRRGAADRCGSANRCATVPWCRSHPACGRLSRLPDGPQRSCATPRPGAAHRAPSLGQGVRALPVAPPAAAHNARPVLTTVMLGCFAERRLRGSCVPASLACRMHGVVQVI